MHLALDEAIGIQSGDELELAVVSGLDTGKCVALLLLRNLQLCTRK